MSDAEEDYMSDNIIAMVETVKPGLKRTAEQARMWKIEEERQMMENQRRLRMNKKTRAEHERTRREEALAKPVSQDSIGFALMAKMGFKSGMSLGKKKEGDESESGIREPINIVVRDQRAGLGLVTKEEKKTRLVKASLEEWRSKKLPDVDAMASAYTKRVREGANMKQVVQDIYKSMKVCSELDNRLGMIRPEEHWFWPKFRDHRDREASTSSSNVTTEQSSEVIQDERFIYANGEEALPPEQMQTMPEEELSERLSVITDWLRSQHFYCLWCGFPGENAEELVRNCPGATREAHEECDDGGALDE